MPLNLTVCQFELVQEVLRGAEDQVEAPATGGGLGAALSKASTVVQSGLAGLLAQSSLLTRMADRKLLRRVAGLLVEGDDAALAAEAAASGDWKAVEALGARQPVAATKEALSGFFELSGISPALFLGSIPMEMLAGMALPEAASHSGNS